MLKEYWRYIKEYFQVVEINWWFFALNMFAAIVYKGLWIARSFVAAMIVGALTEQNAELTYFYVFLFFVVYLSLRIMRYLHWRSYSWNMSYTYTHLQDKIFNKMVEVDGNFTRDINKGELMNTINSDLMSLCDMMDYLTKITASGLQVVAVLLIVGFYNVVFSLVILVSVIVYMCVRNHADKKMNQYWAKTRREDDNYSHLIVQITTGLAEVKTFNMLPNLKAKLKKIENRYDKYYKEQRAQVTIRDTDVLFVYYGFQTLLYIILAVLFFGGQIPLDILILVVAYHETMIDCMGDLVDSTNEVRLASTAVKRVQKILDYKSDEQIEFGKTSIENLNGKIEFKNVSLKIDKKAVLSNVSFKVKPREVVAIVGLPGAGKTMLFNLLLRLRQPTKGEILLDDININEFTKEIYTSSVAIANQTPFIFNTSIRNNLNFANTDIKEQIKACKMVGIHDFIETLPQGYNTMLRENASNVSGGQKQMISIARTILTDSEVLLFDDVTTAIDQKTAESIPKLVQKLKKNHTIIMITKHPEMMEVADKIVVFNKGKIEAIGTHESVFDKSKTYRSLLFFSQERGMRDD